MVLVVSQPQCNLNRAVPFCYTGVCELREGGEEKDDKYKQWLGKTMDLKLRQGIMGQGKEILNFCYNRIFCYSKVLLFPGCLFLH